MAGLVHTLLDTDQAVRYLLRVLGYGPASMTQSANVLEAMSLHERDRERDRERERGGGGGERLDCRSSKVYKKIPAILESSLCDLKLML